MGNKLTRGVIGIGLGSLCLAYSFVSISTWQQKPQKPVGPWYIGEDIQYFPPSPEFKLSREAAAMKAYRAELKAEVADSMEF